MKDNHQHYGLKQKFSVPLRHFRIFFSQRVHNRIEAVRLAVYLMMTLLAIIGLPLHFVFGVLGDRQLPLELVSIVLWLVAIVVLLCYIYNKMSLGRAFFVSAVFTQTVECAAIIYMAATTRQAPGMAYEHILLNELVCVTNFIITCMGLLKNAPTCTYCIFFISLSIAYTFNPTAVGSQFIVFFVLLMTCAWIYMIMLRIAANDTSRELSDYKQTQDSILDMFSMSKVEMIALMQMCRRTDSDRPVDYANVGKLSRHTRDNLILLARYLEQEKSNRLDDLAQTFPMLTPTELDVCHLVLKGMTLKEIAVAMNKKIGNIGTVRGNIRKKLELDANDDLREALAKRLKR